MKPLYTLLKEALKKDTGLNLNEEKTRVYNRAGEKPEEVRELGADVSIEGTERKAKQQEFGRACDVDELTCLLSFFS